MLNLKKSEIVHAGPEVRCSQVWRSSPCLHVASPCDQASWFWRKNCGYPREGRSTMLAAMSWVPFPRSSTSAYIRVVLRLARVVLLLAKRSLLDPSNAKRRGENSAKAEACFGSTLWKPSSIYLVHISKAQRFALRVPLLCQSPAVLVHTNVFHSSDVGLDVRPYRR